ncbi:DUF7059 domain-containing protein [Streptomyces hoynatensis]|uniref:Transferase n=1 Tax=Streptomyces hoynatensis TaxID=1141874 RepID=A0A3A9Z3N8_9ACTN|nr:methyltransferase [Streptomyces hoynatensis]RKN43051.1 transferase [Streptomyces hoynatensis]
MNLPGLPAPGPATARLREALLAASFTPDGLLDLLGAPAYAALARGEAVPALRAVRGETGPLATLTRLFLLQEPVPLAAARAALPLEAALADGWVRPAEGGAQVRATVDVRPYAGEGGRNWWIVADLGCAVGGPAGAEGREADVVLGVGGASTTLAQLTVRRPVGRALDLGTGCGVQALYAAQHAERVTATDVNPRALRVAALTLALSGAPAADLRQGSLYEPLERPAPGAGEPGAHRPAEVPGPGAFDLIVSNPPFVISPTAPGGAAERLTYREGGLGGDALCRTLVQRSVSHLAPGGFCQLLANWQHVAGEDWRERVAAWVPAGCDAWIVQREVQDVTEYTELWLRDAGAHRGEPGAYRAAYAAWLDEFAARRTEAVGLGWITLRRTGHAESSLVVEDWPHAVEQPLGDTVLAHFRRQDYLRGRSGAELLAGRFLLAEGVVQEQVGEPGAEDPQAVVLRQRHGMMRARAMDTVGAGLAGSCDGTLPAGAIVDAIAQLLGEEPATLRDRAPEWLRPLVEQGFLLPAG